MGTQGTIHGVFGAVVKAKLVKSNWNGEGRREFDNPVVYSINGHKVMDEGYDEEDGLKHYTMLPLSCADRAAPNEPSLMIRVLGHFGQDSEPPLGSAHFDGEALFGFFLGSVSYLGKAQAIGSVERLQELTPRVLVEAKEQLGLELNATDVKVHLLYDSSY